MEMQIWKAKNGIWELDSVKDWKYQSHDKLKAFLSFMNEAYDTCNSSQSTFFYVMAVL